MVKKATGITRKVDELGRVVLPIELRRTLKIHNEDSVEIFTDDEGQIILRKYERGCIFCGSIPERRADSVEVAGQMVCTECAAEVDKQARLAQRAV